MISLQVYNEGIRRGMRIMVVGGVTCPCGHHLGPGAMAFRLEGEPEPYRCLACCQPARPPRRVVH